MPMVSVVFILMMSLSRLVIHPPDLTPTIVMSLLLSQLMTKRMAVLIFCISQLFSDVVLSVVHHYPVMGYWTFFVYSGIVCIILFFQFNFFQSFFATFLFWIWTNLGVFLVSGMYAHTINGFFRCYMLALPFLIYSVIGTIFYYGLIRFLALDTGCSNRVFFTAL